MILQGEPLWVRFGCGNDLWGHNDAAIMDDELLVWLCDALVGESIRPECVLGYQFGFRKSWCF
ncbi:MAG: hypothetical protein KDC35_02840 [Acidobacteria bacterium]|nr:hypothetical protein [Acidobacteriota bacterium]